MITEFMDSTEKMAAYLTDNAFLQRYYEIFLSIKDDSERKKWETQFWQEVTHLSEQEQDAVRQAHKKVSQRLYDRMGGLLATVQKYRTQAEVTALV